jgi:hypothetical protein
LIFNNQCVFFKLLNINVDIFGKINAYVVHSCDENGFHRRVQRSSSCLIIFLFNHVRVEIRGTSKTQNIFNTICWTYIYTITAAHFVLWSVCDDFIRAKNYTITRTFLKTLWWTQIDYHNSTKRIRLKI